MDYVALVVDERKALCADFIGGDNMTAAPGRAQQGETGGDKEQNEKDAVLTFDAMEACFELREGACVHDRKYCKQLISKVFERLGQGG